MRASVSLVGLPLILLSTLGLVAEWPIKCEVAKFCDRDFAGSASAAALFGGALLLALVGVGFALLGRIRVAVAAFALDAALCAVLLLL